MRRVLELQCNGIQEMALYVAADTSATVANKSLPGPARINGNRIGGDTESARIFKSIYFISLTFKHSALCPNVSTLINKHFF